MKWHDVLPGDMVMIDATGSDFLSLFEHDVFLIVGIQENKESMVEIQMLSRGPKTEAKNHRMEQNEQINHVFRVYRNGTEIN